MDAILLQGVKTHNLKDFQLILPHGHFYVITGVSGSGKSSLAFDTLYAEGQRRYVESLSSYARQFLERMEKPDVEFISGIPPAIAIQAKNVITNARSTVGTQTEINDYLRILFARIGETICPDCGLAVMSNYPESVADLLLREFQGRDIHILFKVHFRTRGKTYTEEFLKELQRQGFVELWVEGKVVPIQTVQKKKGDSSYFVVVDSLNLGRPRRERLIDSLELANRSGRGDFQIAMGKKVLQFSEKRRCFSCGREFKEPNPNLFSFNSPLGACSECQGFGRVITIDKDLVVPDPAKSIQEGAVEPWTKPSAAWEFEQLLRFCQRKKISTSMPWGALPEAKRRLIFEGSPGDDYFSVQDFFKYLERKTYKMHVRIFLAKYRAYVPCQTCNETRLKPDALHVHFRGKTIYDFQIMSLEKLHDYFERLSLEPSEKERVEPVYLEIKRRVRFLKEVGLGYLSLSRLSRTLSGGEVQRIHLATSLGSALVDTLYVLDEPSVGLHERDNELLIRLLKELRDLGNTVVVVEHDRTMIEAADEVIDLGPLGGRQGGELIFQGRVQDISKAPKSLTGQYLSGRLEIKRRSIAKQKAGKELRIQGAQQHNLKNIDVHIPLGQLVVLTGVSGSGKSTLLYEILNRHYLRYRGRPVQDLGKVRSIQGFNWIDETVLVDQSPIGRTPRSNPATYIKVYEEIRKTFAQSSEARHEGFEARHFSFNVDGGRCPVCKGDGRIKVEMHFLADVFVTCEACQGKRFKEDVLGIRYRGKNIDDVLNMTIEEAMEFFKGEAKICQKLSILQRVGLGYLQLGQSATTLSGGEAQRLKLAFEMIERQGGHILYLFDEPTTGLHYHDIHFLMEAFEELLQRGHSLLVIEHNMEIIRLADYVIDLGPEGGEDGGQVLYTGDLQGLMKCPNSYTGRFLKQHLGKTAALAGRKTAV
ncbi:MAG: excinuclease ABC subunit UvrA [Candidatus Omnitrophica bacterium]|nr:excinuclease ABC subunit UvrA [Candidatus Omnitrophota bacterium]